MIPAATDPESVVVRMQDAINRHDIDALVDCFAPEFTGAMMPAHPFPPPASSDGVAAPPGRAVVHRNWTMLFHEVPDVRAVIVEHVARENTVWTEWEWTGTRTADGGSFLLRGVSIEVVREGRITSSRLYMEPVTDYDLSVGPFFGAVDPPGPVT